MQEQDKQLLFTQCFVETDELFLVVASTEAANIMPIPNTDSH